MLADEVQVENSDLLAKKNKSKLTVRSGSPYRPYTGLIIFVVSPLSARTNHGTLRSRQLFLPRLGPAASRLPDGSLVLQASGRKR
jgi:hypothetical protein